MRSSDSLFGEKMAEVQTSCRNHPLFTVVETHRKKDADCVLTHVSRVRINMPKSSFMLIDTSESTIFKHLFFQIGVSINGGTPEPCLTSRVTSNQPAMRAAIIHGQTQGCLSLGSTSAAHPWRSDGPAPSLALWLQGRAGAHCWEGVM